MPGTTFGRKRRLFLTVGLLALLVVAGCQAPAAEPSGPQINVTGGNLSVVPGEIYDDVRSVMDADVGSPDRVIVRDRNSTTRQRENDSEPVDANPAVPRFYRLLGLEPGRGLDGTDYERMENGVTAGMGFVYVFPSPGGDSTGTEWVLAHEFAHYITLKLDRPSTLWANVDHQTTDGRYVIRAIREGAAILTTDTYISAYGRGATETASLYPTLLAAVPSGDLARYGLSQYTVGYRYVSNRIDDPSALDRVFETPPTTSEQLLHGDDPQEEPPSNLSVTLTTGERWRTSGSDRFGEAFLRYALENGLPSSRAADTAAGWGVDRLYYLRPNGGGQSSYAWVFRWDDVANATEFEQAIQDYFATRNIVDPEFEFSDIATGVRRPAPRTTVVFMGNHTVVAQSTVVAHDDGAVHITVPGSRTTGTQTRTVVDHVVAGSNYVPLPKRLHN